MERGRLHKWTKVEFNAICRKHGLSVGGGKGFALRTALVGAKGAGEKKFWPREGLKTFFHPMCLYSKYSEFYAEFNH